MHITVYVSYTAPYGPCKLFLFCLGLGPYTSTNSMLAHKYYLCHLKDNINIVYIACPIIPPPPYTPPPPGHFFHAALHLHGQPRGRPVKETSFVCIQKTNIIKGRRDAAPSLVLRSRRKDKGRHFTSRAAWRRKKRHRRFDGCLSMKIIITFRAQKIGHGIGTALHLFHGQWEIVFLEAVKVINDGGMEAGGGGLEGGGGCLLSLSFQVPRSSVILQPEAGTRFPPDYKLGKAAGL